MREKIAIALVVIIITIMIVDFSILRINHFSVSGIEKSTTIGVYEDSSCSVEKNFIDWGVLEPGDEKNVTIYVQNECDQSFILFSTTQDWNPKIASNYLNLNFSTSCPRLEAGEVIEIVLTLSVSPHVRGVSEFSFNITFQARKYLGDINGDGTVNMEDLYKIAFAYQQTLQDERWNPYADLNNDRIINMIDLTWAAKDFGKPSSQIMLYQV